MVTNPRFPLFHNFHAETGNPYPSPNTLLIDSEQLEAGDALDPAFREFAKEEIEQFRREIIERTGDRQAAEKIPEQQLLREVLNTVGKPGQLGAGIRCVVSVSMLTEGWDANTVTHVLGIRAFGTQLLCEQVIGRALRRQSYDINANGLFSVEYADVFGIPFDFTAKPVVAPPQKPREVIQVRAIRPERDALEIRFPRVEGYRRELPPEEIDATYNDDSVLTLTPDLVGASRTVNSGIIGEAVDLNLKHMGDVRDSTLLMHLTMRLIETKFRDPGQEAPLHLFGKLKRVTKKWLDTCLQCKGETNKGQLLYQELADMACNRIANGIGATRGAEAPIKALLDPYNPSGSTAHVLFNTTREDRWTTDPRRCHVNYVMLDSDWEAEFCRVAESHPLVRAYVKNYNLGLAVPYLYGSETRKYIPDFVVLIDLGDASAPLPPPEAGEGRGGWENYPNRHLLHLIVEIKGFRREDAKDKKAYMDNYWIPGVNQLGTYGRWAFAEFTDVYEIESEFAAKLESEFAKLIESAVKAAKIECSR